MSVADEFTPKMKEKLAARLRLRPDRSDTGQTLPRTQKAWDLLTTTTREAAARTEQIVNALQQERLIVPIEVEEMPTSADHRPRSPRESSIVSTTGPWGASAVAFTSSSALARWDPSARPTGWPAYQLAAATLAGVESGTVILNPSSDRPTLLPRAAVLALCGGDTWLPAWADLELKEELTALAQEHAEVISVGIRPIASPASIGGEEGAWDGAVAVDLFVNASELLGDFTRGGTSAQARLGRALSAVGSSARLREAAQHVELVPRPASIA